jgi:hypothetical protein
MGTLTQNWATRERMGTLPRYATSRGGPVAKNREKIPSKMGRNATGKKINPKDLHQSWFMHMIVVVVIFAIKLYIRILEGGKVGTLLSMRASFS